MAGENGMMKSKQHSPIPILPPFSSSFAFLFVLWWVTDGSDGPGGIASTRGSGECSLHKTTYDKSPSSQETMTSASAME